VSLRVWPTQPAPVSQLASPTRRAFAPRRQKKKW
jgi:hypothetical protein